MALSARASNRADRLNRLLIRWGKLLADLEALEEDGPSQAFITHNTFGGEDDALERARLVIEDVIGRIGREYAAEAVRATFG